MAVIQLSFDDFAPWWADSSLWENHYVDTVQRDTEDEAFDNLYHQARAIERTGRGLELSGLHKMVLRLEYQCKKHNPHYLDVPGWIAQRVFGIGKQQAQALLDECSAILYARELLGMDVIPDWLPLEDRQGRAA